MIETTAVAAPRQSFVLPPALAIAQLFALGLLAYTGGSWQVAVVLGLAQLIPYFVSSRISTSLIPTWFLRLILYAAVVAVTRAPDSDFNDASVDPHNVVVMGYVCASEFALQCWRLRPAGEPPGTVLVFFSGVTFMAASYTFNIDIIRWSSPVYFLLAVVAWRSFQSKAHARIEIVSVRGSKIVRLQYAKALSCAILIGVGIYSTLWVFRDNLEQFGQQAVNNRPAPESTGMSAQPQLGSTFGLQGSPRRVLRISGALDDPHLRGATYDVYANGGWGPAIRSRDYVLLGRQLGAPAVNSEPLAVTTLAPTDGMLFAPLQSSQVRLSADDSTEWAPKESSPIQTNSPIPASYEFAGSDSTASADIFDGKTGPDYVKQELAIPSAVDRRVLKLADKIGAGSRTDTMKVDAVVAELIKNHQYSLTTTVKPGDPISGFILSHQAAHCEFFASAAVILLRCLHVPARYVTGYYAHESGPGGTIIVRQRDAHAWAEAYIAGRGWTTVDATPGGGRPDELFSSVPWWQHAIEWLQDEIEYVREWAARIGTVALASGAASLALMYFGGTWLFNKLRRKETSASGNGIDGDLAHVATRFSRLLRRAGAPCPAGRPWSEHVEVLESRTLDRGLARRFVASYNNSRFGRAPSTELTAMLSSLERASMATTRIRKENKND